MVAIVLIAELKAPRAGILQCQEHRRGRSARHRRPGNGHTVGERRDVQHVEERGFGRTDLATGLDELQIGGDFNGATSNLGRNSESLEERGLSGSIPVLPAGTNTSAGATAPARAGPRHGWRESWFESLSYRNCEDETDVAYRLHFN